MNILIGRIHQTVEIATFQQSEVTGAQCANLERTFAIGHFAPVAHNHEGPAFEHQKNFLIIAVAMQTNPAVRPENMQVHVLDDHEWFVAASVVLRTDSIDVPSIQLTT